MLEAATRHGPPRLAPGTELLGQYQGSGYTQVPYLLRRHDGRVLEVSPLLHLVAESLDGRRDLHDVARRVGAGAGRRIDADQVAYLVEHKLRPLGVMEGEDPARQSPGPHAPALSGLTLRAGVVPPSAVRAATTVLRPLFHPLAVVAVLGSLLAVDAWLVSGPGLDLGLRDVLDTPALLLLVAGLTVAGGAFHELGHATASRYGGAEPGVIGAGIYLIWSVFYNDVNDSYRLDRAGRLRVDLGGVYFNAVFVLALAGAYALSGFRPLLVVIALQHLAMLQQFLPFLRLDGYYVVSDLAGVPDLFGRIRPVLSSLVPGSEAARAASDLRRNARLVVTAWVLLFVQLLTASLVVLAVRLPHLAAATIDSMGAQARTLAGAVRDGHPVGALVSGLQLAVFAVPVIGMAVTLARALRRCRPSPSPSPSPAVAEPVGRDDADPVTFVGPSVHRTPSLPRKDTMLLPTTRVRLLGAAAGTTFLLAMVTLTGLGPEPGGTPETAIRTEPPAPTGTPAPGVQAVLASATATATTVAPPPPPVPTTVPARARPVSGIEATPRPVASVPSGGSTVAARRQPSSAEVQEAIEGVKPYVESLFPVSPTPAQVDQLGNNICTAFDQGQSYEQVKATGRALAKRVPYATLKPGGEEYIVAKGVALYCPDHSPELV